MLIYNSISKMSTSEQLTINFEKLSKQRKHILNELSLCELELKQLDVNQNNNEQLLSNCQKDTIARNKIREYNNNYNNNRKNDKKILLTKQKLKWLNGLQNSSKYTEVRKERIKDLEYILTELNDIKLKYDSKNI